MWALRLRGDFLCLNQRLEFGISLGSVDSASRTAEYDKQGATWCGTVCCPIETREHTHREAENYAPLILGGLGYYCDRGYILHVPCPVQLLHSVDKTNIQAAASQFATMRVSLRILCMSADNHTVCI